MDHTDICSFMGCKLDLYVLGPIVKHPVKKKAAHKNQPTGVVSLYNNR